MDSTCRAPVRQALGAEQQKTNKQTAPDGMLQVAAKHAPRIVIVIVIVIVTDAAAAVVFVGFVSAAVVLILCLDCSYPPP
jgi:hypothetical protein